MSGELRAALDEVARRLRNVRLWAALAACWLAWLLVGIGLDALSSRGASPLVGWRLGLLFAGLAGATGLVVAVLAYRSTRDRRRIARRIEAKYPELATGLLVVVEGDAEGPESGGTFLRQAVLRGVLDHRQEHDWDESVPGWTLWASELSHAATLGGLIVVTLMLALRTPAGGRSAISADAGRIASGLVVEPGDAEIERGTSLLVVARFNAAVPGEATLVVEGGETAEARRPMARSLEDPTFAARIDRVQSDLTYRIAFAGRASEPYRVTVFDYPEVLRADADLAFPEYTGLSARTVEDIRHVTAVEGTELTLRLRLNKEVASARLVDGEEVVALASAGEGSGVYATRLTLTDPKRYRVELVDRDGRSNENPTELSINVTRNRPADVRVARPARDVRVSPIEELSLGAELADDFGLVRHGVTLMLAGKEPQEIVLGAPEPASKEAESAHLIAFEALGVEPDQLASYHFWAEDIGPDGRPRRTSSDMYFAEIRPFEEIFRQGEQPSGGQPQGQGQQGGNAQQAMELAELQKQIINATWGLIRRASVSSSLPDSFASDAGVVLESQRSAIEQAGELAGELRDPGSIEAMGQATGLMEDAADRLSASAEGPDAGPLEAALASEQAAYQALLKLRDREFQVVQGQPGQGGGGGGAGGPSQRQLQELELSNDENRYEQQRSAQQEALTQQTQEQRELRQVLNRLQELARRQEDLNERLQELQSALEAAEDERQREEIERQLKRLREQQQQMLRDADELRERMEREENRDRMAEARQQVEESREHLRQASEALEQGQLSQAITEGTRAGRQLDELREELRQQTSDRFAEDLREMRDQARRLADSQDELTERLSDPEGDPRRSLRGESEGDRIGEELAGQREQLDELLERLKQTVQDAEETEPLLAEELFDAIRRADQQSVSQAIEAAEQLAGLGVNEEAARASRAAAEGLDELSEGVDRAADRVLGGDTAALRLAQNELDDLAEQVGREIERSASAGRGDPVEASEPGIPGGTAGAPADNPALDPFDAHDMLGPGGQDDPQEGPGNPGGRQDSGDRQQDEPPRGERPPGRGQQGEGQPEEQQPGEGRPGDGQPGGPQPEEGQEGEGRQPGEQGEGEGGGGQQGGQQQGDGQGESRGGQDGQGGGPRGGGGNAPGLDQLLDTFQAGGRSGPGGPITGGGFREWSDRMRDVEELLDDPELSAEAARIRDRVRGAREEFRRHAKEPDWDKLQGLVAEPIRQLRDRVAEELRRRESPDDLVPIDRDPVPPRFAEGVRRYFERLGSGE